MADVRLTATNPEDSSVVPVACDAAGRLLLEEPVQGPPGPQGEQGPPGQDGQDGDPFSGNFAGDVTFGGSASIAKDVVIGKPIAVLTSVRGVRIESGGSYNYLISNDVQAGGGTSTCYQHLLNGSQTLALNADGSAQFAGRLESTQDVTTPYLRVIPTSSAQGINLASDVGNGLATQFFVYNTGTVVIGGGIESNKPNITLNSDGSAKLAGGKAGFTKEGYLWCTTRRGDTVILDATSNGLASWVEYTPTTRLEEIRDKLDANGADNGEMPADTQ